MGNDEKKDETQITVALPLNPETILAKSIQLRQNKLLTILRKRPYRSPLGPLSATAGGPQSGLLFSSGILSSALGLSNKQTNGVLFAAKQLTSSHLNSQLALSGNNCCFDIISLLPPVFLEEDKKDEKLNSVEAEKVASETRASSKKSVVNTPADDAGGDSRRGSKSKAELEKLAKEKKEKEEALKKEKARDRASLSTLVHM